MNEWHNCNNKKDLIDISYGMKSGTLFDNNVIHIEFFPIPQPKPLDVSDFFYCSLDCLNCQCYHCKLEGL